jgi:drug/metabolite transporter (DMT)-like permease
MNLLSLGFLLLSGVLGIGLGDTFYFEALNNLGARRTLLLQALAPPLAALIALIFLQESLIFTAWMGILLTVLGVSWVISERVPGSDSKAINPLRGVSFALLSALGQASGAVLSRAALAGTEINPLWSTLLRLIGGTLVLLLWMFIQKSSGFWLQSLNSKKTFAIVAITALFSTYLGIWLQLELLKLSLLPVLYLFCQLRSGWAKKLVLGRFWVCWWRWEELVCCLFGIRWEMDFLTQIREVYAEGRGVFEGRSFGVLEVSESVARQ